MLDATWSFRSLDSLGSVLMVLLQEIFEKNLGFFLIWKLCKIMQKSWQPNPKYFRCRGDSTHFFCRKTCLILL
jgi:hypothetical protein